MRKESKILLFPAVIVILLIAIMFCEHFWVTEFVAQEEFTPYLASYNVSYGDTLSEIAEDYFYDPEFRNEARYGNVDKFISEIVKLNNLGNKNTIDAEERIYIPCMK